MSRGPWQWIKSTYLRMLEPVVTFLVAAGIKPNTITVLGMVATMAAGAAFAMGAIRAGGWILGLTAGLDVLDGAVARRTGTASAFGAFFDSALDRIGDGALLCGLAMFWAGPGPHHSIPMAAVALSAVVGAFLTSYTRARAEGLGIDASVGWVQRPERIVLLAVPQALFGLALDGRLLQGVIAFLSLTSWVTVAQRIAHVRGRLGAERR